MVGGYRWGGGEGLVNRETSTTQHPSWSSELWVWWDTLFRKEERGREGKGKEGGYSALCSVRSCVVWVCMWCERVYGVSECVWYASEYECVCVWMCECVVYECVQYLYVVYVCRVWVYGVVCEWVWCVMCECVWCEYVCICVMSAGDLHFQTVEFYLELWLPACETTSLTFFHPSGGLT